MDAPNTLSELSFAYAVIWLILFLLLLKILKTISGMERQIEELGSGGDGTKE